MRPVLLYVRALVSVPPAVNDHWPALRVGLGVTVPVLVLLIFGHPELTIYAVFGAFTGMYGRGEAHQLRLVHQAQAGAVLLTGVTVGVALSITHIQAWGLVSIEAFLAGLGSLVADKIKLRPAEPFFGIFALGACASIPTVIPLWTAALICAASALFSLLVGFAGWFRNRTWDSTARRTAEPRSGPWLPKAGVHATRYVVAVAAAGALGLLLGIGHAYWAMAAAAVPLAGADLPSRVERGIHRVLGTYAGLGVTAGVLLLHPGTTVLVILVMVLQFPTELFMVRHYGLALVFFTPVILLMTQLASPVDPMSLLADRGLETLIGAMVGITVVLLIRDRLPGAASHRWKTPPSA
ncbi:FUSC family protein [Cryobacterium sp. Hz9]|uniref:FUSC family protein n=1 Tax=Cryobacterium sp. Hz9 TaxID=1259167 RepID=UPI00106D2F18|nr:FUSC family protein [Cryobacterium sp. Hz9]TFB69888.1 FUSC family protein [Cryobacterium sp. Hz9]